MTDFRFPAPPREEQEINRPPLNPPISQTAQALPLSQEARAGGQGKGSPSNAPSDEPGSEAPALFVGDPIEIPDAPEAPQAPDLPRVDPEEDFPGGRPERDQGARNRQAIQGLLGAVGAALAPQDSPVAFNVASGLSQGAARQARTSEEEFRQRQQAFREFVTDAQRYNRKAKQAEAEREFESQLQDFESRMGEREQAIEAELDRRRAARERQQELRDDRRDQQQAIEQIQTRGRQRRRTAQTRAQGGDGEESGPSLDELRQEKGKIGAQISLRRQQIQKAQSQLQQAREDPASGDPEVIRERISRLQQDLDELRSQSVALDSEINARAPQDGQSIPEGQRIENRRTFMDTLPPGMGPEASGAGGNQQGRQFPARDTTRRGAPSQQLRSQGRRDGGQSGSDPVRQAARQQAARVDTVTQADIGAAVEQFGEGSDEVRLLREIRRVQQSK